MYKQIVGVGAILALGLGWACVSFPLYKSDALPVYTAGQVLSGQASYYANDFQGKTTANGEKFDMYKLTAAHRSLPFGTKVRVTNLINGEQVMVTINDRGPFKKERLIDLSFAAARELNMIETGTAKVKVEIVELPTAKK
jgi:rare lipoprotein A